VGQAVSSKGIFKAVNIANLFKERALELKQGLHFWILLQSNPHESEHTAAVFNLKSLTLTVVSLATEPKGII
jgi:hypothetical protein